MKPLPARIARFLALLTMVVGFSVSGSVVHAGSVLDIQADYGAGSVANQYYDSVINKTCIIKSGARIKVRRGTLNTGNGSHNSVIEVATR